MSYNPGDVLKERYIIREVLGKGSMGEVYRAEHVTIHRQFAIKLMHVHIAEKADSLARFRREANAAAQLDHPHICQVTDFDSTENGDFYLVMEFLNGETLRDRLERLGKIEIDSVFRIMLDLLSALQCAHESGIVHRDVKPENIALIKRDERDDYVKLIDFGIAHADITNDNEGTLTQAGQVYGTPQYLSPEQVMGDQVDLRADLYSCGCLLYEMIEGTPPFDGDNYILLLNKHLVLDPPHLTSELSCAQELDEVIQRLLMKHPEDRYGSAREVRAVLTDIANRFDPSLNLRMSQSGSNEPALIGMQSGERTPKLQIKPDSGSAKGRTTISNPYINPDEVALIQTQPSRNKNAKDNGSHDAENASGHAKKSKNNVATIIFGTALVLLAAALLVMLWKHNQIQNQPTEEVQTIAEIPQEAAEPTAPTETTETDQPDELMDAKDQSDPESEEADQMVALEESAFALSDEAIAEYAQIVCPIPEYSSLYKDKKIQDAAQKCVDGNFEAAFATLDKLKNKYHDSSRYTMMMMFNAYALKKYHIVVRNALSLINIDPGVVCHDAVRDIMYSMMEDNATSEKLQNGLSFLNPARSSEALSWLLLRTPCNQYQTRFERIAKSLDSIETDIEEEHGWLGEAVGIWRPFKVKGACHTRQARLDAMVHKGLEDECNALGDKAKHYGRCSLCYSIWKKRMGIEDPVEPIADPQAAQIPQDE